jgi:putative transposase
MRRSRFTDGEILHLIREAASGVPIPEICRAARVSIRTFYRWRNRLGGLTPSAVHQLKDLEAENRRLHRLVVELRQREARARSPAVGSPSSRVSFRSELGAEPSGGRERPRVAGAPDAAVGAGPSVANGRFASLRTSR